jgi:hypothetical protein
MPGDIPQQTGYYLTQAERDLIAQLLKDFRDQQKNTVNRPGDQGVDDQEFLAPEVYVALTPVGGIAPVGREVGTGTFDPSQGVTIHSALCSIFQLITVGVVDLLYPVNALTSQKIYNLSNQMLGGGEWVLVHRDKYGNWFTLTGISSGGGAGLSGFTGSFLYCDGDGTLHRLTFQNGLLLTRV